MWWTDPKCWLPRFFASHFHLMNFLADFRNVIKPCTLCTLYACGLRRCKREIDRNTTTFRLYAADWISVIDTVSISFDAFVVFHWWWYRLFFHDYYYYDAQFIPMLIEPTPSVAWTHNALIKKIMVRSRIAMLWKLFQHPNRICCYTGWYLQ